jgi:glycosyltransferase involved in cell wall biosynthesis
MANRVLFVESGRSGYGSFESLYGYLSRMDTSQIQPVVAFLNRTSQLERFKALGFPVYLLRDMRLTSDGRQNDTLRKISARLLFHIQTKLPMFLVFAQYLVHLPLIRQIKCIIRQHESELLYLNDHIDRDFFGVFIAQSMNMPCISHLRSVDGRRFTASKCDLANRTITRFIANSSQTSQYWVEHGLRADKIDVVYNAVPLEPVIPYEIREEFSIPFDIYCIGIVGRLVALKGHRFLLEAYRQFVTRNSDSILFIVGEGEERDSLERQVEATGLAQHVVFAGYRPEAKRLIAALDLVVIASSRETFGRVAIEGMQTHTPVIATRVGGVSEIVRDGETGLLVEYGDVNGLVSAMEKLYHDPGLCLKLAERAYEDVEERFGLDRHVQQINTIIARALHSTHG